MSSIGHATADVTMITLSQAFSVQNLFVFSCVPVFTPHVYIRNHLQLVEMEIDRREISERGGNWKSYGKKLFTHKIAGKIRP